MKEWQISSCSLGQKGPRKGIPMRPLPSLCGHLNLLHAVKDIKGGGIVFCCRPYRFWRLAWFWESAIAAHPQWPLLLFIDWQSPTCHTKRSMFYFPCHWGPCVEHMWTSGLVGLKMLKYWSEWYRLSIACHPASSAKKPAILRQHKTGRQHLREREGYIFVKAYIRLRLYLSQQ